MKIINHLKYENNNINHKYNFKLIKDKIFIADFIENFYLYI